MSKIKKIVVVCMLAIFSFSLLTTVGCSKRPNEEQISAMEEARSACLAAEQKLSDIQSERATLEGQLQAKKAELDKAQQEKAHVEQGLSNWNSEN